MQATSMPLRNVLCAGQVLTLVAMEPPVTVSGSGTSGGHIRDAKARGVLLELC